MSTFRTSGDFGDICFMLPLLRSLTGRHTIYLVDRNKVSPFTNVLTTRAHLIIPLLKAQKYVEDAVCSENTPDFDICPFRMFHSHTTTLVQAQLSYFNMLTGAAIHDTGEVPWLTVDGERKPSGKVIVARSPRYNNPFFPWREIVEYYGPHIQFVGLDNEYYSFQAAYGSVDRVQVTDFLELAKLIRDSELFIGNQSSPHAIAMGLGVPIIQEVCLEQPDCIYKRSNVQYVADGSCTLPNLFNAAAPKEIACKIPPNLDVPRNVVPPGHWQYPSLPPSTHFSCQLGLVQKLEKCSVAEADEKLVLYNLKRIPDYFKSQSNHPRKLFEIAMEKAFKLNTINH